MKIIKKLYFKNPHDNSKHSIIDVSSKRLKKIKNEFKKDNNIYLEIENEYYVLQKNNEKTDCYKCAFLDWCSCAAYISGYGYDCLPWPITKNDYYIFKKVEEYEMVFGENKNEDI